jgi:hypothetical protein
MTEHRRHPDRPTDGSPGSDPAPRRGSVPWIVSLALASVLGALLFAAGYLAAGAGGGTTSCAAPDPAFDAFCEAYEQLQRDYVDDLDPEKLAEGAIEGMFQYGVEDPYSGYMPPEEYQTALGDLSGTFSGIGAEMAIRNTPRTWRRAPSSATPACWSSSRRWRARPRRRRACRRGMSWSRSTVSPLTGRP